MLKKRTTNENLTGNDLYEGFCVDLLERISVLCNFTYEIKLVDDGFHGSFSKQSI